jgi:hypothetical protein
MPRLAVSSAADGVQITLTESGKLKVAGPRDAVARVVSDLRPSIQALRSRPCPDGTTPDRSERLRQGALRFAAEWAADAVSLGWSLDELFAVAEPLARVDLQGAAWFIGDASVTGVSAAAITLRTVPRSERLPLMACCKEVRGEDLLARGPVGPHIERPPRCREPIFGTV